jgi:hypothetical protein
MIVVGQYPTGGVEAEVSRGQFQLPNGLSLQVPTGRFVLPDGTLTRRPNGAVGAWIAESPTATSLTPGKGTIVALKGYTGFGSRAVDSSARTMDYDGIDEPGAGDVLSRGFVVFDCSGGVAKRYYLDVYPALGGADKPIGAATRGSIEAGCGAGIPGVGTPGNPTIGPSLVGGKGGLAASCRDRRRPSSKLARARVRLKRGRVSVRGRSRDRGCAKLGAVLVSIGRPVGHHRCRFLQANGRLGPAVPCRRPVLLRATGTRTWRLATKAKLPRGTYRVLVRAIDRRGNRERPSRRNHLRTRVR